MSSKQNKKRSDASDFSEEASWRSLHADYISFAISTVRNYKNPSLMDEAVNQVDRQSIEAIRYSYDAIEAAVEFVHHQGETRQLTEPIKGGWLTRYLRRNWSNLSLADKLGMMANAWRGTDYWPSDDCFQLFCDLKLVRDGLTHPIPYGEVWKYETSEIERVNESTSYLRRKRIGDEKLLRPGWLSHENKSLAKFSLTAERLRKEDAEKAVEIMLCMLVRLEDVFYGRSISTFSFFDGSSKKILAARILLQAMKRRFGKTWPIRFRKKRQRLNDAVRIAELFK